jgi:hypothetical protein
VAPGPEATGRDVSFGGTASPADVSALRADIEALAHLLRAEPPGIEDAAELAGIADLAQHEAAKDAASKHILRSLLGAVMAGAGGVASIAAALTALQHAISALQGVVAMERRCPHCGTPLPKAAIHYCVHCGGSCPAAPLPRQGSHRQKTLTQRPGPLRPKCASQRPHAATQPRRRCHRGTRAVRLRSR